MKTRCLGISLLQKKHGFIPLLMSSIWCGILKRCHHFISVTILPEESMRWKLSCTYLSCMLEWGCTEICTLVVGHLNPSGPIYLLEFVKRYVYCGRHCNFTPFMGTSLFARNKSIRLHMYCCKYITFTLELYVS